MPEVKVTYSENLPGGKGEFKSRRFTCELSESNVPAKSVKACTENLFRVAKEQVKAEISRHQGLSVPSNGKSATTRQISAIFAIAKSLNLSKEKLEGEMGKISTSTLTTIDASKIIESLKQRQAV